MPPPHLNEAKRRLREIIRRSDKLGIPRAEVAKLSSVSKLRLMAAKGRATFARGHHHVGGWALLVAMVAIGSASFYASYDGTSPTDPLGQQHCQALVSMPPATANSFLRCRIQMPKKLVRLFRPPDDCSMCKGLRRVDKVSNLSPGNFQNIYSDQGRPVVITDATRNWSARQVFSFRFLQSLHRDRLLEEDCQIHAPGSSFPDLSDIFNDSRPNSSHVPPRRIQWRSCGERVAVLLRQHYGRPYFLPASSQESKRACIYLGSRGYGETASIEATDQLSWQAQIKGSQRWFLYPPPECYYQCESLEVTLGPGDIIVVDTMRWYHETAVVSDEFSIAVATYFKNT